MATDSRLSPNHNVGAGVRRINKIPMMIVVGIASMFTLIIAVVAINKNDTGTNMKDDKSGNHASTRNLAMDIVGENGNGYINGPTKEVKKPVTEIAEEKKEVLDNTVYIKESTKEAPLPPVDLELEQIRQLKAQMFMDAVKTKTKVSTQDISGSGGSNSNVAATANNSNDPRAVLARIQAAKQADTSNGSSYYNTRMNEIQQTLSSVGSMGVSNNPPKPSNSYDKFSGESNRWSLANGVESPDNYLTIRAGTIIPGLLVSTLNSDLPGVIHGQVAQNVYDTPTGQQLLIPQGSKLIGQYEENVQYGQNRVLIAWQRIVYPDGKALDIDSMVGADGQGRAGLKDKTNNHYLRIFGSALFMSGITAGISYSTDKEGGTDEKKSVSGSLTEALGQQLGAATTQMLNKNMSISPTIEIRPGFRFNIIVTKDIAFDRSYSNYDY